MNCLTRIIYFPFLLLLILLSNQLWADHKIDSLLNVAGQQKRDTNQVKTLIKLSSSYLEINPDSAFYFCKSAYELSDDLNYTTGKLDALYNKSNILTRLGQYDSALVFNQKAIKICESYEDKKRLADHINAAGYLIMITDNNIEALKYYRKSYQLYQSIFDSVGMARAINAIGVIHKRNAEYDSAVHYYIEYLSLCEDIGYTKGLGAGLINLGQIYLLMGDYQKAESNFLKSIEISKKFNRERHLAVAYIKLGISAFEQEKYDEALEYYQKTLEINKRINNVSGLANVYNNIGNIYWHKKKYNQAQKQYEKAFAYYKQMGDKEGIVINLVNQAMILEKFKKYDEVLKIYDTCLLLLQDLHLNQTTISIYKNIYKTWELKGNYPKAFEYIQKYMILQDSIFNVQKNKDIAEIQLKYDTEKKEAKILSLENVNLQNNLIIKTRTNQRNIYMFSGSGLIIIGLLLFGSFRQRVKRDRIISRQRIRQLEEEKKLLAAKSLVIGQEEERKRIAKELHDGLGVILSTAKMHFSKALESKTEDPDLIKKATRLLEQAATDVRRISHNMMPGVLTRLGLVEAIEDMFEELNEIPGTQAISSITGEEIRLPENTEIMLYRVFQEIINNTLKHANATEIGLNINFKPNHLQISVSDNGKGFIVKEKIMSKSIGLNSIQSRVNFMNGNLKIDSTPGHGTIFNMIIPYSDKSKDQ